MYRISLTDQFSRSERRGGVTLDLEPADTLRDLIRRRIQAEVKAQNRNAEAGFTPLIPPTEEESTLNEDRRHIDWEDHFRRAIDAYRKSDFFVFVDGKQAADLDAPLELRPNSRIEFARRPARELP